MIGLLWLLCRLLPRLPATIRCALWWLIAAQLLMGLAWPAPVRLPLLQPAPVTAVVERTPTSLLRASTVASRATANPAERVTVATHPSTASAAATPLPWREILTALWLAGLVAQLAVTARQWQRARRRRDTSRPLRDPQLQALCSRQAQQLGLRTCPDLRVCDAIESPQITGCRHPVVLWPARHALAPDECAMALAHELAHLRRGDLWLVWAPVIARWLFFFHPLVHLAVREYGLNREAACDGQALRLQRARPGSYGQLLLRLGVETPMPAGLAGVASPSFRHLQRRLVMLEQAVNLPRVWDWLPVLVMALAFVVPYRAVAANRATANAGERPATGNNVAVGPHSTSDLSVTQENGHGSLCDGTMAAMCWYCVRMTLKASEWSVRGPKGYSGCVNLT